MSSATQESGITRYLAVIAPVLYLLNLLLLPGLAFLILAFLFIKYKNIPDSVARVQVRQNFYASIASGIAIVGISIVIIAIGGFSSMYSWMIMLLYALSIHATLVLLGALALAKGINRKPYVYPGLAFLTRSG